jgi:hypothetical protein
MFGVLAIEMTWNSDGADIEKGWRAHSPSRQGVILNRSADSGDADLKNRLW